MVLLSIAFTRERPQETHAPNSVLLVIDRVFLNYTNILCHIFVFFVD